MHVRWQYWAHPSGLSIVILWVNTNSQKGKSYAMPLPEVSDVSVNSGREEGRNDDESGMIGKRQRLRRLKLRLFISPSVSQRRRRRRRRESSLSYGRAERGLDFLPGFWGPVSLVNQSR